MSVNYAAYSKKTISTYSIIGAYLVDIYYNHLYNEAIKLKEGRSVQSITEGYKYALSAFLSAMNSKSKTYNVKSYNVMLIGINEYFSKWSSFSALTIAECIDKISYEFIPADYYNSLDNIQKHNIVYSILTAVIKDFTVAIIDEFLGLIIDNHDDHNNIELLKEKIMELFCKQREEMYNNFIKTSTGRNEFVSIDIANKMRDEIKKLTIENQNLKSKISELEIINKNQLANSLLVVNKYKELSKKHKATLENIEEQKITIQEKLLLARQERERSQREREQQERSQQEQRERERNIEKQYEQEQRERDRNIEKQYEQEHNQRERNIEKQDEQDNQDEQNEQWVDSLKNILNEEEDNEENEENILDEDIKEEQNKPDKPDKPDKPERNHEKQDEQRSKQERERSHEKQYEQRSHAQKPQPPPPEFDIIGSKLKQANLHNKRIEIGNEPSLIDIY
jgi:hypothetical protein